MSDEPQDIDSLDDGPIIGRRRSAARTASFTLVTYDGRDRETHHKLTARVDFDASSVFGFLSPKLDAAKRVGALQNFLFRSLVDSDGISVNEEVRAVVPDPRKRKTASSDEDNEPGDVPAGYVLADSLSADDEWDASTLRFIVGDQTVWDSAEAAEQHAREHGSSKRRFTAIMDDNSLIVEQSALEEIVQYLGRQGGDRPTKPSKSSSGSRRTKAPSAAT